jgi:chromosome partitioning protein
MRAVAVYNMKGGVGKTTASVNLSYLAAAAGQRVLLWDLDPQAASSFAFRVRPRVAGFSKKSLESGGELGAAIKQTDYHNLDLLPADFAYRKLDRILDDIGKPERVFPALLDRLGRDYDVVFLDCPAGFSLLTQGVFAAADMMLVPTIPTVLSLRTIVRLIKCADRCDSPAELAAFFSMVDRRKGPHRRACEWSMEHHELFLSGQIPYAGVVEQMAVRRLPLPVFAARDSATTAFAQIWMELQTRLPRRGRQRAPSQERWVRMRQDVESLINELETMGGQEAPTSRQSPAAAMSARRDDNACVVHRFDTEQRDLQRGGRVLELLERQGHTFVVAAPSGSDGRANLTRAHAQIDNSWAVQILSGQMSPLAALERRLGSPGPPLIEDVRALIGGRRLQRIDSHWARQTGTDPFECRVPDAPTGLSAVRLQGDPERVARHDDRRILVRRTATSHREAVGMSPKFGR